EVDLDEAVRNVVLDVKTLHVPVSRRKMPLFLRNPRRTHAVGQMQKSWPGAFDHAHQRIPAGRERQPVPLFGRAGDEGPTALLSDDEIFSLELRQSLADGHAGYPEFLHQLLDGWKPRPLGPLTHADAASH